MRSTTVNCTRIIFRTNCREKWPCLSTLLTTDYRENTVSPSGKRMEINSALQRQMKQETFIGVNENLFSADTFVRPFGNI